MLRSISKVGPYEEDKEMITLRKNDHLKLKPGFFIYNFFNNAIITFFSLITFWISEVGVVSFDAVLCMFREPSAESNSV